MKEGVRLSANRRQKGNRTSISPEVAHIRPVPAKLRLSKSDSAGILVAKVLQFFRSG